MSHPYLFFSNSTTYARKLVVGTSSYTTNSNGITNKDIKIIEIPFSFNGTEVAELGPSSLRSLKITSVFIPKTIRRIGQEAFNSCQFLTEVRFEKGSKLQYLGLWVFHYCTSLKKIDFPASITSISVTDSYFFLLQYRLNVFHIQELMIFQH